ncbi:MAG: hypothetical protein QOJ29_272 [Thermoleophilaceae bacterium]|nr:hypothetical protein [Thermoleophilaceae bacterium]
MRLTLLITLGLAAAVCTPQAAVARSPLKRADMKTIRADSVHRAKLFAPAYHAKSYSVTCHKTTPYTARCFIRLVGTPGGDCTITTVYAVKRTRVIEGDVARDGCS